jgi:hypothetical protein
LQKKIAESGFKHGRVKLRQQSMYFSSFNQQIVAAMPHSVLDLRDSPEIETGAAHHVTI